MTNSGVDLDRATQAVRELLVAIGEAQWWALDELPSPRAHDIDRVISHLISVPGG